MHYHNSQGLSVIVIGRSSADRYRCINLMLVYYLGLQVEEGLLVVEVELQMEGEELRVEGEGLLVEEVVEVQMRWEELQVEQMDLQ